MIPFSQRKYKFRLEKLTEAGWIRTAVADEMEACQKHAAAVGGQVRAVNRDELPEAYWVEGELVG